MLNSFQIVGWLYLGAKDVQFNKDEQTMKILLNGFLFSILFYYSLTSNGK